MELTIEIDNTRGKIISTLNLGQLSVIEQICMFRVEGGEYNPKFKGEWDGYKRMFNTRYQTFPIGLLDRIRNQLSIFGVSIKLIDKRKKVKSPEIHNINAVNYTERQYQTNAVISSLMCGNGIVKVATGGGKTTIAARTIAAIGRKSIFIVHTKDLLYQTIKSFKNILPSEEIGQIGDGIINYGFITVATIQTLSILGSLTNAVIKDKYDEDADMSEEKIIADKQKMEEFNIYKKTVEVIMMDEVQRVCSSTAYSVRFLFDRAMYAFGYSASPWRDDGSDLMIESAFGQRIVDISASDLIRQGYLVKPTIIIKDAPVNVVKGNYSSIYKSQITDNMMRNYMLACDAISEYKNGKNVLILVTMIEHGKKLESMIKTMGVDINFISGKSAVKKRTLAIENMRNGKTSIMIASTIADVGLDIPRLDVIIEGGAGKSSVTALQRLGRIMRIFNDKTRCTFYTYRDNVPYIINHIGRKIDIWKQEPEFIIIDKGGRI